LAHTIALDAMGGDFGPSVVIPAALQVLKEMPHLKLILVGDRDRLVDCLRENSADVGSRLQIQHASQQVEMDESPSQALRSKKTRQCVSQSIKLKKAKPRRVSVPVILVP